MVVTPGQVNRPVIVKGSLTELPATPGSSGLRVRSAIGANASGTRVTFD